MRSQYQGGIVIWYEHKGPPQSIRSLGVPSVVLYMCWMAVRFAFRKGHLVQSDLCSQSHGSWTEQKVLYYVL
jgi:hypothetical protein